MRPLFLLRVACLAWTAAASYPHLHVVHDRTNDGQWNKPGAAMLEVRSNNVYLRTSQAEHSGSEKIHRKRHYATSAAQELAQATTNQEQVAARDALAGAIIGVAITAFCLLCVCGCCAFRAELSKNMREPGEGWIGRMAISMMDNPGNQASSEDMVQRASVSSEQIIVELGPGNGHFLRKAAETGCKKIYGLEISAAFRAHLERTLSDLDPKPEIRGEDAKSMSFLEDESVDCILGMNVVYFLEPLLEYLAEFKRVLKPGGSLFWGCKFEAASMQDSNVARNSSEAPVVEAMTAAGFKVVVQKVDLGGGAKGDYVAIIGSKE